ncbi:MAG: menaquinone biosynthesis protein [Armatimonadetes bacterium]|nr:menaquinone biosynthesis protein [Armatimonadota bacterium]MDW8028644.1 menaquinone biosynthesis protein [Armatimonadota bacterium]
MVIGSVPYLNAVPLTWALHKIGFRGTLVFGTPAQLSFWLEQGKIDAGLIPIAEYLRGVGYGVVADVALVSDGAVRSVLLVSKVPLFQIETVAVDKGSRSSVLLLKVLMAESFGLKPLLFPTEPDLEAMLAKADAALLIGDAALLAQISPHWQVFDLGQEWKNLTGLPFVFATWVIGKEGFELASWLLKAKTEGLRNLDAIVVEESQKRNLDPELVRHYLTECIRYELTELHLKSIRTFAQLCVKHKFLPFVREVRLVNV